MHLDASHGEGGGQIVRTAVSLSAVTGTPVELTDVRASRDPPGLAHQHLAVVRALAEMCSADVEGAEVGATELVFRPGDDIEGGRYEVDIGTAGSATLLMHAGLPAAVHADGAVELHVAGGTDVRWSPTIDYFQHVTLPLLRKAGVSADVECLRRGHYPKGGGEVAMRVQPAPLQALEIPGRGGLNRVRGAAHVTNLPLHIAEREAEAARKELDVDCPIEIDVREEPGVSAGTSITLWAEHEDTVVGGSALGEKGKPAEEVGREAADNLRRSMESDGTVDTYSADQLLPYLALAGGGYRAPERTSHLETNAWVCEQLTGQEIGLDGDSPVEVACTPTNSR